MRELIIDVSVILSSDNYKTRTSTKNVKHPNVCSEPQKTKEGTTT
jgi:hypothetical protein